MMQSLLADRFKVVSHTARQARPVLELVLVKQGRTGPQLQPHSEKELCSPASTSPGAAPGAPVSTGGFRLDEIPFGSAGPIPAETLGHGRLGGRRVAMG